MVIPFVDLKQQYLNIKEEIDKAISDVIQDTAFIKGKYVELFENSFKEINGVKHCICVGNGTDSLYIIMKMLGIGQGDEVITAANSWISSSETISQTGAKPVFIDANEYYLMDVSKIEEKINSKTRAIMPVHLYGQMVDMTYIEVLAKKYNLYIIEDCAQSHLSTQNGRIAGTIGIASSFSFYPGKNLGAYGDAGCILTNDDDLASKCRMYANHGSLIKHQHIIEGINSRMDGMQGAILNVKLKYLKKWNSLRNENAKYYSALLKDVPQIVTPLINPNNYHTFHLYVVKAHKRDELMKYLKSEGISCEIHYPIPLALLKVYDYLKMDHNDFSVVKNNQSQILSLPNFPELTNDKIEYIVDKIKQFYFNQ